MSRTDKKGSVTASISSISGTHDEIRENIIGAKRKALIRSTCIRVPKCVLYCSMSRPMLCRGSRMAHIGGLQHGALQLLQSCNSLESLKVETTGVKYSIYLNLIHAVIYLATGYPIPCLPPTLFYEP